MKTVYTFDPVHTLALRYVGNQARTMHSPKDKKGTKFHFTWEVAKSLIKCGMCIEIRITKRQFDLFVTKGIIPKI